MKKKLLGLGMGLAILTCSISAFADTGWFSFQIAPATNGSTGNVLKTRSESYASITQSTTNMTGSDRCWYRVRRSSDAAAATESVSNIQNRTFAANYLSGMANTNQNYYLNVYADPGCLASVIVTGSWQP